MKRLAIKKLIVISQSESRSLEVPFENGLNIILGGNKTCLLYTSPSPRD